MAESQYSYGTTLLTSKAPNEAATLIPHAMDSSKELLEKRILRWFMAYTEELQRNNQGLKKLYEQGSVLFNQELIPEYVGFHKIWNCLLNSVQTDISTNEGVIKALKMETVKPLKDMFHEDVRISELTINSQELKEISHGFSSGDRNAEVSWNMKAPQAFDTFESYKKKETQVLFDISYNFFNAAHNRLQKCVLNNENSVNYILSNYKIDEEMETYLAFLSSSSSFSENGNKIPKSQKVPSEQHHHRMSQMLHSKHKEAPNSHDTASLASSTATSKERKRSSMIRSRVGSMFGRKNKGKKSKEKTPKINSTSIPEHASAASSTYDLQTRSTMSTRLGSHQLDDTMIPNTRKKEVTSSKVADKSSYAPQGSPALPKLPEPEISESDGDRIHSFGIASGDVDMPKSTSTKQSPKHSNKTVTATTPETPNFEKYESDSSEDYSSPVDDKQVSVPQPQELEVPALEKEYISGNKSNRNSKHLQLNSSQYSISKYSFEAGDEDKALNTPQESTSSNTFGSYHNDHDPHFQASTLEQVPEASPDLHKVAPPPPPSRKVLHSDTGSSELYQSRDSESINEAATLNSANISANNLNSSRYSSIQPHMNPLSVQNTGSSGMKMTEIFKHFDSNSYTESMGLNSSIAEVINVNIENSKVKKSQVIGEIAFNYIPSASDQSSTKMIRIPEKTDRVVVNNNFVETLSDSYFQISLDKISNRTLGGIKYLRTLNESEVPIMIHQIWKYEDHQASLMISIKMNPAYSKELQLNDLVVAVNLAGCKTTGASSRPQGSFNKEKNRITWRFDNALNFGQENLEQKLIARFNTLSKGHEHESGVQLKFTIQNPANSVSIVDEKGRLLSSVHNMVSGSYSGHSL